MRDYMPAELTDMAAKFQQKARESIQKCSYGIQEVMAFSWSSRRQEKWATSPHILPSCSSCMMIEWFKRLIPLSVGLLYPIERLGSMTETYWTLEIYTGTATNPSVHFSHSVMSNFLWAHGLQHTPGLPVHHQLPEFTQTHVHCVGKAIQATHLLLSPSPPIFNPSPHQGHFKWVNASHQVAKVFTYSWKSQ